MFHPKSNNLGRREFSLESRQQFDECSIWNGRLPCENISTSILIIDKIRSTNIRSKISKRIDRMRNKSVRTISFLSLTPRKEEVQQRVCDCKLGF